MRAVRSIVTVALIASLLPSPAIADGNRKHESGYAKYAGDMNKDDTCTRYNIQSGTDEFFIELQEIEVGKIGSATLTIVGPDNQEAASCRFVVDQSHLKSGYKPENSKRFKVKEGSHMTLWVSEDAYAGTAGAPAPVEKPDSGDGTTRTPTFASKSQGFRVKILFAPVVK